MQLEKMSKNKHFISALHNSTSRDVVSRMNDNKIECMEIAKKYDYDYWDGDRRFGYGGYKYIPGRWSRVAENLISNYKLNASSSILDLGAGKGYLLYEIKKILPSIKVVGVDNSSYAINNAKKEIQPFLIKYDLRKKLPFKDDEFDLVMSLGTLHNLKINELKIALYEMNRVAKNKYLMVESYRNNKELFNLQCWALTAESFFEPEEWKWIFNDFGYDGDYEFIFFE